VTHGVRADRRQLLRWSATSLGLALADGCSNSTTKNLVSSSDEPSPSKHETQGRVKLVLCGDVMLGRGIDQIQRHATEPELHEGVVQDARTYVALAERANGPIPRRVSSEYVWGDALVELSRWAPDARIINLETSVTTSDRWVSKGINYRMHPSNVACLTAAGIDCCILANNHVLDYGRRGLADTLMTLEATGLKPVGAGKNLEQARAPQILPTRGGSRVIVVAMASESSGVPPDWGATSDRSGVFLLENHRDGLGASTAELLSPVRRPGDVLLASIHWGGNWGYHVPEWQRRLAHELIDEAGVDIVHGHSSHHPKPIEVYKEKLILYGCGDFLNDYEGISGREEYRAELVLFCFVSLERLHGKLHRLSMTPLRIERFRLQRATREQAVWLGDTLDRWCRSLGTRVEIESDNTLTLRWG
jgi:poly-gamma-glutamate capsule biosynthesis protein CapA/YwtB (metallophosphatase superfamily)